MANAPASLFTILPKIWLLTFIGLYRSSWVLGEFDANFTLQNVWGRLPQPGLRSMIQCISSDEAPNEIKFTRKIDTGQGTRLPKFSQQFLQGKPIFARIFLMPSEDGMNRFGAFQCKTARQGVTTEVVTLKLPPLDLAELDADTPYRVANAGDSVDLEVKVLRELPLPVRWRHNGRAVPAWNDKLRLELRGVTRAADGGLYECYHEGRRGQGLHALIRLVVRSCPQDLYGDGCGLACPPCRNGGVCHDEWGVCVCPAGFTGATCDLACGGNHFGADCSKLCTPPQSNSSNMDEGCAFHLFCKPDPYGCSCAPGFKGPQCMDHCEPGWFGADCRQPCRCAYGVSACNRITGHCDGGCTKDYHGGSCQIHDPDATPNDFVETTTMAHCPLGSYGPSCEKSCHCSRDEGCDVVTGQCPGGCREGWGGASCSACASGRFGENCGAHCHCEGGHYSCDRDGYCYSGCEAGWAGFTCQQECTAGRFGANCASTCHCRDGPAACHRVTGACSGDCKSGYTGGDCQTLCPPDAYGVNCAESCTCSNGGQCSRVDGTCACSGRWRGTSCSESEPQIVAATDEEANAGQQLFLSCTADAVPAPDMNLSSSDFPGLTFNVRTLEKNQYQAVMRVKPASAGEFSFKCTTKNPHGFDMKMITLSVIEPPRLLERPQLLQQSSNALEVGWRDWAFSQDSGGKVSDKIEYLVVFRKVGASGWERAGDWQATLEASVEGLQPDTRYEVAVRCRRRGKGAEGAAGPLLVARTKCGAPTADGIPQNFLPEKITQTEVDLAWEPPPDMALQCQLAGYSLSYHLEFDNSTRQTVDVASAASGVQLKQLQPNSAYVLHLHPVTAVQRSEYYAELIINTTEALPAAVTQVDVQAVEEPDLLLVTWREPAAGYVSGYVVTYDLVDRGQCGVAGGDAPGKRHVHSADTEVTLQNLHPYSTYNVSIRARNSAGEGDATTAIAVTSESGPDAGPANVRVSASSSSSLRFRWDPIPCEARNGDVVKYEYALLESELVTSPAAAAGRGRRFADIGLGDSLVVVEGLEAEVAGLSPDSEYGFAVRGHTRVEPGPFTDFLFHRTREDLPDPPGSLEVISAGATHLVISWSRPHPANGRIVGYRIQLWNHLGADVAADLTRNATNDAERLSDAVAELRPATDYFVKIKAATSVGWGEWSHPISGRTLDDVPDAPSEISVLQSAKETLKISWTTPVTPNGVIVEYKVTYRPVSSADPMFDASAAEDVALNVNNKTTEMFLKELRPSTQYNVSVQARTSAGHGPAAWLMAWTDASGEHLQPTVRTLDVDATNETIPIVFSTSGKSSVYKYQVIVEDARHDGPIDEGLLDGHQRAVAQRQLPYYIAAEWDASALAGGGEHHFVVGDRKAYGGYTNVHLNPGHEYKIRIRTLFLKNDKVKSILSEPKGHTSATSVFKVDHKTDTKVLGLDLIVFVLVLISTLVLIIIIAFISGVIICTKRQQKKSTSSFSTRDSALSESLTWSVMYKVPETAQGPPVTDSSTLVTFLDRTSTFKRRQNEASRGIRNEDLFDFMNNSNTGLQLTQEYKRLVSGQTSHWTAARKTENMKKNRYSNILPYDRNRVVLQPEFSRSDYINASYVDGYRRPREYIVTQGPIQATINDFWKMVWQENCPVIVMVTNLVENGKAKCVKYWPDETMICGNMEILLIHLEDNDDFAVRTLLIRKVDEGSTQRVQQYQYTDWADRTIPSNPNSLLKMIKRVRGDHPVLGGPMIVHCSGGAGRSGACLALDALCQQAEEEKGVDVFRFVDEASRQRVQFLQTLDQYAFVYEALLEAVQHEDTSVPLEEIGRHLKHLDRSSPSDPCSLVVRQFNKLNRTQKKIDVSCCSAALSDCNIFKNRDPMTVPVDSERIKLIVEDEDEEGSDYINAVLVHGHRKQRQYLVTQMPMQHTVEHFWRMVYQHQSSLILMLNAGDETDDLNVGIYWPDQGECSYGDFDVQLVTYESQEDYIIRIMKVSDHHQAPELFQKVIQLQYKADLTDAKPASVIKLVQAVDVWYQRTSGGPISVHCMDGATECGLFLSVDIICNQMKSEAVLDVFQVVKAIRLKRPEFVRNIDQYRMCFEVAQELAESEETSHARRKVSIKI